ncbi:MAG: nitroreductase family deazaflavin-dependent oxidoreductase [Caldilineaceae bacterium]
MANQPNLPSPPTGISRFLFRLPIQLYRLHLGWLLGRRFVLINHIGRKSGQVRQVVVEVVRHDQTTDSYIVCSGFGRQAQWYQNLLATPAVTIQVRRAKWRSMPNRSPRQPAAMNSLTMPGAIPPRRVI